jgi:hypothetical protein
MSKDVAVISAYGQVVNIAVQNDDYVLQPYEVVVTGGASIGGDYVGGVFYPPQPFPSWTRGEGEWLPPVSMPDDGERYVWNESAQEWQAVETD